MEYHKTKDSVHVKQTLGHKSITSIMIYINLEAAIFRTVNDEFNVRVAHGLEEACKFLEVEFECVTETDGARIL